MFDIGGGTVVPSQAGGMVGNSQLYSSKYRPVNGVSNLFINNSC